MKMFSELLFSQLDSRLNSIKSDNQDAVKYAEIAIKTVIPVFEQLKTKLLQHSFITESDEISFFRETKPQLASKLIYYNDIYNIETNKPYTSKKIIRKYYNTELIKLEDYFAENLEFYRYFRRGSRNMDNKYFIRGRHDIRNTLDSFYFQADYRFSTSHDYKVARILANEKIKMYLDNAISILDKPKAKEKSFKTQKWTGSKVGLIELIYALHTEGVFNNGCSELKEVTQFFESAFNIDLGQFNRTFLEIRSRKSERTKFLNLLKEKLILRMEDADENQ